MIEFNTNSTLDAVAMALADTFEGIAFSQILDQEQLKAPPVLKDPHFSALIHLPSPISITFLLAMNRFHAQECFEAMAPGISLDENGPALLEDFVRELTNTAAGHLHTILAPQKDDMIIGLPEQVDHPLVKSFLTPSAQRVVLDFLVEEHHVLVSISQAPTI